MELFLLLIQIPVLIFIIQYIRKFHSDPLFTNSYYFLLSFKITSGIFLGILYFTYYKSGGDTIAYSRDLDFLSTIFYSDYDSYIKLVLYNEEPLNFNNELIMFHQPRAYLFIRLISPLYILVGSNYWLLSIYLSLFSFSGFWILSNTLIKLYKLNSLAVLVSFFVFPSVVFWSSGVIKESLIMGIICLVISMILNMVISKERITMVKFVVLLLFLFCLLQIKFYYFAVLVSVLFPYSIIKLYPKKLQRAARIIGLILLMIAMACAASLTHPLLHIDKITESVYLNYIATIELSMGYNFYTFQGLSASALSFVEHIPKALIFGLFGPFLWHCNKLIALLSGIENMILLLLFSVSFVSAIKNKFKIDVEEISLIVYIVVLASLMAFASPNWGSLVRYKIGYLPFFLILLLNKNPLILQLEANSAFVKRLAMKA